MQIEDIYKIYQQYPSVQTDTRKLKKGDIFFALKGPNFNGNLFAKQALDAGASYMIVDEQPPNTDERFIKVNDVLQTLQQLAKYHRLQFNKNKIDVPFIAITGSNGKTTTKELLHEVLSKKYITYTTEGNLNNHIGVPLTLLRIRPDAQMAIIEMGANHLNEIASYCEYAMPTHGLITNIGKAHLEGFGGVEGVKKGKGELFDYLAKNNGIAFVNADDINVTEQSNKVATKFFFGKNGKALQGSIIKSDPFPEVKIEGHNSYTIQTRLAGSYNLPNVLAAACIGRYFNVSDTQIKQAIENYTPSNSRSQLMQKGTNTFILDAYNANPGSMKAAIENFAEMKGDKKILLLGSMMELGENSRQEHEGLITLIDKYDWKAVALTGAQFNSLPHKYLNFENASQVKEWLHQQNFENAQILIKGSRSMQMEKVLD